MNKKRESAIHDRLQGAKFHPKHRTVSPVPCVRHLISTFWFPDNLNCPVVHL